jgi:hypothetical protein
MPGQTPHRKLPPLQQVMRHTATLGSGGANYQDCLLHSHDLCPQMKLVEMILPSVCFYDPLAGLVLRTDAALARL